LRYGIIELWTLSREISVSRPKASAGGGKADSDPANIRELGKRPLLFRV